MPVRSRSLPPPNAVVLRRLLPLAAFFATSVAMAVDLDASPAAPAVYAQEIVASATSPVTLSNVGNGLDLSTPLAYSFSQGEVRHARLECPGHVRFAAGAALVPSDAPSTSLGAINGLGGSVITFSVTALTTGLSASDRITVTGDRTITSAEDATCTFALYDTPSQAIAGGTTGRIVEVSGAYLDFAPSVALRANATTVATADVEGVDGPYSRFVVAAPTNDATLGQLGGFSYGTVQDVLGSTQPLGPLGTPITLAELMDATTALVVSGDFEAASGVFLSASPSCATVDITPDSTDASGARFPIGATSAIDVHLCYGASVGEIQPSRFSVALEPVAASADVRVTALGPESLGEIIRNGTDLIAPLVEMEPGAIARIVLTNTGTEKRSFSLRLLSATSGSASEPSSTYIGLTSSDGSIPAEGAIVINLADAFPIERFDGAPRGSVRAIVAAPSAQIQGLYQIIRPSKGVVSNHVMVRAGTN